MKTSSREFFIDGKMILVRPLVATDPIAARCYADCIGPNANVIGELSFTIDAPLRQYRNNDSADSSVYVAVRAAQQDASAESELVTETGHGGTAAEAIGFGVYIRNPVTLNHEFSVVVNENFSETRLALELIDSLVLDAAENGVQTLTTEDSNADTHMQHIAKKLGMSSRLDTARFRHTRYTLQVDKHPGIVTF
jgi:hypothetical protein